MQTQWPGSSGFWALCLKEGTSHPPSKYSGWKYNSGEVLSISPRARYCSLGYNLTHERTAFRSPHVLRFTAIRSSLKGPSPGGDNQPSSQPFRSEMWELASTLIFPYVRLITEKCNSIFSQTCSFSSIPALAEFLILLCVRHPNRAELQLAQSCTAVPTAEILKYARHGYCPERLNLDLSTAQQWKG